jgi:hypothetical protein
MDWKTYESVTKYIYETLGQQNGVKIEGYGNDCKVVGHSGVENQIDVLASHSDGIHTYKTAVECKYWKDTVNKDIVMKVREVIEDAKIHKGVIVSRAGFTPDAITYARHYNIGLVELREMEEKDREGRPQVIVTKSEGRRPKILNVFINVADDINLPPEEIVLDAVTINYPSGESQTFKDYMTMFHKELHRHEIGQIVSISFRTPGGKISNSIKNTSFAIHGITFRGVLTSIPGPKFHPVDEIWLIMKLIFEEKSYTISRLGNIREEVKK